MSALPFTSSVELAGLRMTADEYFALGETPDRFELFDGVVVMSRSPRPGHNRVIAQLIGQFYNFSLSKTPLALFPETDLQLSPS